MLLLLFACSRPPCSTALPAESSMIDIFIRLENDQCLHSGDIDTLDKNMQRYHTQTTLHCDQVYRRSSTDGLTFTGSEELVLESASVADVVIDNQGRHIIAYNDTSTETLVETARTNPSIFWARGLIGFGGLGLAVDSMNGHIEYLTPNLNLKQPLELVDPDIGLTTAGQYRLNFFAVAPQQMNRTQHGPMAAAKPHNFYRTVSESMQASRRFVARPPTRGR